MGAFADAGWVCYAVGSDLLHRAAHAGFLVARAVRARVVRDVHSGRGPAGGLELRRRVGRALSRAGLGIVLWSVLTGCKPLPFPNNASPNYTHYTFEPNRTTPGGIGVDDARHELGLVDVDVLSVAVGACLGAPDLPADFGVKVPLDWYISPCSGEQVFPCDIGPEGCLDKGQRPSAACPCRCRAVVQDARLIVTAPNLRVYAGRLVALWTGVENPWAVPDLAACASILPPP